MKLLLVVSSLGCGGAERAMSELANAWANRGWDVGLATYTDVGEKDFYPVHRSVRRIYLGRDPQSGTIGRRIAGALGRVIRLRRLLRLEAPHAVLSFIDVTNVTTIMAGLALDIRVVVSERIDPSVNTTISPFWHRARAVLYRYADLVVAQTAGAAQWLREACSTDVAVIPNWIRELPSSSTRREPLLLSVGRLDRQKGFDVLLRAFARIHERHPEWRLDVLGDGPEQDALLLLQKALGLGEKVCFHGQVGCIESWYARAGVLAQASRFEGFPNVLLEAMGMGTAVISTACRSGPEELIEDGVNGRLVPVDDVEALAHAMSELISDEAERLRLGTAAREVRARYSQARILPMWESVLRGTVSNELGPEMRPGHVGRDTEQ